MLAGSSSMSMQSGPSICTDYNILKRKSEFPVDLTTCNGTLNAVVSWVSQYHCVYSNYDYKTEYDLH